MTVAGQGSYVNENDNRPTARSRRNRHDLRPLSRQERNVARSAPNKDSRRARVFSNLDDRFFSEWLYLCDDCHAKACAGIREVASLIHGPMEWTSEHGGRADAAVTENSGAHDDRRRSGFPASSDV